MEMRAALRLVMRAALCVEMHNKYLTFLSLNAMHILGALRRILGSLGILLDTSMP